MRDLPAPPRPTDVLTRLEEEELRRPRSVISRGIAAIVCLLMYLSLSVLLTFQDAIEIESIRSLFVDG